MSLTELALLGLAAAALATGPAKLWGLTRSDPLLPLRLRGWALAFVAACYAVASRQPLAIKLLVPAAAALWAFLYWARTRRIESALQGVKTTVWPLEVFKVFILSCPFLAVLGGLSVGRVEPTDVAAAAAFGAGALAMSFLPKLRVNPAVGGHLLVAVAFWLFAWRDPIGHLTVFAPLLAWAEGAPLLRAAQNGPAPMSDRTQVDPASLKVEAMEA